MTGKGRPAEKLAWHELEDLRREHGDAFYLLDVPRFEANLTEMREAFCRRYPNSSLAYSYKTNYIPDLCRAADRLGAYAEVVSAMEYDLARRLRVEPSRILFNGPAKSAEDVERALLEGAVVNLDSVDEVDAAVGAARRNDGRRFPVGLRCNVSLGKAESRFGLDEESGELAAAFTRLGACPNLELAGLHCHVSARRQVPDYQERTRSLLDVYRRYAAPGALRFFDIGGGFFGRMGGALRAQFREPVPTYEDYAAGIGPLMAEAFPGGGPELILEPGAAVVADAMAFVVKIQCLKRIGNRALAVTAGSVQNIKPYKSVLNLPLSLIMNPQTARLAGRFDIMGYTCMEDDYLYRGFEGALGPGDFVVLENVGAYTVVFKPPFIRPAPAILRWNGSGDERVVRRRGSLDEVVT